MLWYQSSNASLFPCRSHHEAQEASCRPEVLWNDREVLRGVTCDSSPLMCVFYVVWGDSGSNLVGLNVIKDCIFSSEDWMILYIYVHIVHYSWKGINYENVLQVHLQCINILIYELSSCHVPFQYVPSKYILFCIGVAVVHIFVRCLWGLCGVCFVLFLPQLNVQCKSLAVPAGY